MRSRAVWFMAQAVGAAAALAFLVVPSYALVDLGGELRFSTGQVLTLIALGIAWGDMRRTVSDLKDDVKELRKDIEGGK